MNNENNGVNNGVNNGNVAYVWHGNPPYNNVNNVNSPYDINLMMPYEDDVEKGITREECSICMDNDPFTYKNWARLRVCDHAFHKHCIDLWMERSMNPTCPLCMAYIITQPPPFVNNDNRNEGKGCQMMLCCLIAIGLMIVLPTLVYTKTI